MRSRKNFGVLTLLVSLLTSMNSFGSEAPSASAASASASAAAAPASSRHDSALSPEPASSSVAPPSLHDSALGPNADLEHDVLVEPASAAASSSSSSPAADNMEPEDRLFLNVIVEMARVVGMDASVFIRSAGQGISAIDNKTFVSKLGITKGDFVVMAVSLAFNVHGAKSALQVASKANKLEQLYYIAAELSKRTLANPEYATTSLLDDRNKMCGAIFKEVGEIAESQADTIMTTVEDLADTMTYKHRRAEKLVEYRPFYAKNKSEQNLRTQLDDAKRSVIDSAYSSSLASQFIGSALQLVMILNTRDEIANAANELEAENDVARIISADLSNLKEHYQFIRNVNYRLATEDGLSAMERVRLQAAIERRVFVIREEVASYRSQIAIMMANDKAIRDHSIRPKQKASVMNAVANGFSGICALYTARYVPASLGLRAVGTFLGLGNLCMAGTNCYQAYQCCDLLAALDKRLVELDQMNRFLVVLFNRFARPVESGAE